MNPGLFEPLGLAVLLGLLVGLQREWSSSRIAGIRTFPLITLLGALAGILAGHYTGWVVAAGWLALVIILLVGNLAELKSEKIAPGMTTEIAALVMYGVGAMLAAGHTAPAIVVGGIVAVLLYAKDPLHDFARKIGENDVKGIIQLALIGLVILPGLPDQTYGPYQVLNPYKTWLMVVLIAAISLCGYVIYRILGARGGAIVGGLIGGLISSTATTVSFTRQTRQQPIPSLALMAILMATIMMNIRVLTEIGVVAPGFLPTAGPPLGAVMGLMIILSVGLMLKAEPAPVELPTHENPTQLKTAVFFGLLYSAILLAVAAAKEHFGDRGLYMVAVLSGLTDMDAITLSTSELVKIGRIDMDTGWRVVMTASLANLAFKWGAVALLGSRALIILTSVFFGIILAGGCMTIWLWP
jgi:uncharacterized membrane protein (DUF4010 family)